MGSQPSRDHLRQRLLSARTVRQFSALSCVVLAMTTTVLAGHTGPSRRQSTPPPTTLGAASQSMIGSGCIPGPDSTTDRFRLGRFTREDDLTPRPGGSGHQVFHGITIGGGLRPSTNIAAQTGALDPTASAVVLSGGIGERETAPVVDVRLQRIRPLTGC
jgi:hypothetical protein